MQKVHEEEDGNGSVSFDGPRGQFWRPSTASSPSISASASSSPTSSNSPFSPTQDFSSLASINPEQFEVKKHQCKCCRVFTFLH
ncbi:hypothetical protein HMI56_005664 [Coelomomyces lativittatus]|nr:hypothetical protein HMI56_005664 [Coelomomyces lativittatus]